MFEQIYKYPSTVRRHRRSALAKEREAFLEHLAKQGYPKSTLFHFSSYLLSATRALPVRRGRHVTREEIRVAGLKFGRPEPGRRSTKRELFVRLTTRWLRFMGLLKETPERLVHAPFIEQFLTWMHDEKGLSSATAQHRCWNLTQFFRWYESRGGRLSRTKVDDVDGFLEWSGKHGWSRRSVAARAHALRPFFQYAGTKGWCRSSLADSIEGPKIFAQETLPAGPAWKDTARLIASTDTGRPSDIRDRAILMLLAIYGLRAGEVIGLRLEDIEWDHNRISIRRPKIQEAQAYPLIPVVGQAIIRYLREIRPRSIRRELFLTLKAPVGPLRGLHRLVRKRMLALDIKAPHLGPHALRHSCATRLLSEGFSFKEIGDHLGHKSIQSASVYAKVDMRGLEEVAAFDLGGLS